MATIPKQHNTSVNLLGLKLKACTSVILIIWLKIHCTEAKLQKTEAET